MSRRKTVQTIDHRLDRAMDHAITVGLAVLILVGFATSYRTLRDLAVAEGGYPSWLAPSVPLSFDLGIVVISLKVARSARQGRTAPVLRLLVALLSGATVLANASAARTPSAALLHAVPPAMFVVCFESVIIAARRQALADLGLLPEPIPRLRLARWLLAFPSSWLLWREMVLCRSGAPAMTTPRQALLLREGVGIRGTADAAPLPDRRVVRAAPTAQATTRDAEAKRLLVDDPSISAPELANRLTAAGWPVSPRTAQRLRVRLIPSGRLDLDVVESS